MLTLLARLLISFIQALNSNDSPRQLGLGFALGAILGLTPVASPHNLAIMILIYIFNVNLPLAFWGAALYKILALFLSGISDMIGYALLVKTPTLFVFWTTLYNLPIIPWTKFYNTVVLGGFLLSLILFIPNYFLAKGLVHWYRKNLHPKLQKMRIYTWLKSTLFFNWYEKYNRVRSAL